MALTDPVNVMAAEQRRRLLIQKLAAQLQAKNGASTRAGALGPRASASVGRPFGNATDLRTAGPAPFQLPFTLPNGRVRPSGFEPTPPDVIASAPPAGGGMSVGAVSDPAPTPLTVPAAAPTPNAAPITLAQPAPALTAPALATPTPMPAAAPTQVRTPGPQLGDSFNSDTPLSAPAPVAAMPAASLAPAAAPTPYQMMMSKINQLRIARLARMGVEM